jgi:hypothetical protein
VLGTGSAAMLLRNWQGFQHSSFSRSLLVKMDDGSIFTLQCDSRHHAGNLAVGLEYNKKVKHSMLQIASMVQLGLEGTCENRTSFHRCLPA